MLNIAIWYSKYIEKDIIGNLEKALRKNSFNVVSYSNDEEARNNLKGFDHIDETIAVIDHGLDDETLVSPWVIEKIAKLHKNNVIPTIAFVNCKTA